MNKIIVLSKNVSNQIAAGEVVERPASIVKELVENSIDAGSTSVSVEIKGGGIDYIRVTDNGHGIAPEDACVAFERHATSKISQSEDLTHIDTLGFRGEALASIAAIAEVVLKTRTRSNDEGTYLRIEGGELKECKGIGCPEGTSIEVSNVFYNVPARLKFLKSQKTEAGLIGDYVSRIIMSQPGISFKFINNEKLIYHSYGDFDIKNAIYCIYGADIIPHLKYGEFDDGYIHAEGYFGTDVIARSNRLAQTLFINGRYIKSSKLSYAVQRAYDTRLMSGRFPFYVLNIKLSSNEIDVNVHPNKLEVRFKQEDRVYSAATIAARHALEQSIAKSTVQQSVSAVNNNHDDYLHADEKEANVTADTADNLKQIKYDSTGYKLNKQSFSVIDSSVLSCETSKREIKIKDSATGFTPAYASGVPEVRLKRNEAINRITNATHEAEAEAQVAFGIEAYKIIGQIFDTYWIVQQGERMFLIDQHAAHERKIYDMLLNKIKVESQVLLVSSIILLTPVEYQTLTDNIEYFRELGFDIEEFGGLNISVSAVPYFLGRPEPADFIREVLAGLSNVSGKAMPSELRRDIIIQTACKNAIKAGNVISPSEIEALLALYAQSGSPMTCPHGRPVMVQLSKLELQKMFKRVL